MVTAANVLLGIAIACALCGVASAVLLTAALQRRGVKIDWFWLRLKILSRYLGQYRDITRQETGHVGPFFYSYVASMILALVTAILGLVLRAV